MKIKTIDIAVTGILCALIAVITLIPFVGFIPLIPGMLSFAAFSIALVLVGGQTQNVFVAIAISTFFGLMSMTNAFIRPSGIMDTFCQNPLLSVLPRIFIGLTTYYSYKGFSKVFRNKKSKFTREYLPSSLSAIIGTLTNTILFLSMLMLLYHGKTIDSGVTISWTLIGTIILTNTIAEVIFSALVVPPIVVGVNKALNKYSYKELTKKRELEQTEELASSKVEEKETTSPVVVAEQNSILD